MKFKKVLMLMLALLIAIPTFASKVSKVEAYALPKFEGDVFEVELDMDSEHTALADYEYAINTTNDGGDPSTGEVEFISWKIVDDDEYPYIKMKVKALKAGDCNLSVTVKGEVDPCGQAGVVIYPTMKNGETRTFTFEGATLITDQEVFKVGDVKEFTLEEEGNLQFTAAQVDNDVVVTVKGIGTVDEASYEEISYKQCWDGGLTLSWYSDSLMIKYLPSDYLDLDESEKEIDQLYNLEILDETYTDTTKVKIEWEVPVIEASYSINNTWNPDTLEWDETKEDVVADSIQAKFTFTNYSSVKVVGKVEFNVEEDLASTLDKAVYSDNQEGVTIDEAEDKDNIYSEVITVDLSFVTDEMAKLEETYEEKYGTYTITIEEEDKE